MGDAARAPQEWIALKGGFLGICEKDSQSRRLFPYSATCEHCTYYLDLLEWNT